MLIDSFTSGGAQRQFLTLANGLANRGYHVSVYCYHDFPFFEKLFESDVGVNVFRSRYGWMRKLKCIWNIFKGNADVRVSFLDTPNVLNLFLKLLRPKAICIVSERNTDPENPRLRRRVILYLYKWADRIVTNSKTQYDRLNANPQLQHKEISYIVNAVDTEKFAPSAVADSVRGAPLRGIVVARYAKSKNLPLILDWGKQFLNETISFEWYGEQFTPSEATVETVYQKAAREKEESGITNVSLNGPSSRIAELYRECDFMCLPSFHEGTANVICEALASGLPIICSDVCDNPILVEDGVNGFLFDPHSVESFDRAIGGLLALSQEQREEMGLANRRKAIELFSHERFIDRWEEVIFRSNTN
jgi:glycosyltransferase involved in cell wall biosynthesis